MKTTDGTDCTFQDMNENTRAVDLERPISTIREHFTGELADWAADFSTFLKGVEAKAASQSHEVEAVHGRVEAQVTLKETLKIKAEEAVALRKAVHDKDLELEKKRSEIHSKHELIDALQRDVQGIERLKGAIRTRDKEIARLVEEKRHAQRHAAELLTRQEVNRLIDHLKERAPKLVEEIIPDVLKPGEIQRVLQALLRERVPIRDLETILETIGDLAARTKDTEILTEYARSSLARTLCHQHKSDDGKIHCITLDPALEELFGKNISRSEHATVLAMPSPLQAKITRAIRAQVEQATTAAHGRQPIVLCPPQIRAWVRKLIEVPLPSVAVLSYSEIVRGFEVETHGMVVLGDED